MKHGGAVDQGAQKEADSFGPTQPSSVRCRTQTRPKVAVSAPFEPHPTQAHTAATSVLRPGPPFGLSTMRLRRRPPPDLKAEPGRASILVPSQRVHRPCAGHHVPDET